MKDLYPALLILLLSALALPLLFIVRSILANYHRKKTRAAVGSEGAPAVPGHPSRPPQLQVPARGREAPPAPESAGEPPDQLLSRARALFADGLFREAVQELARIPRLRWGEAECSLALRAGLRLNDFGYAKSVAGWAEKQGGLRDSALLQYLFAIVCERAGDVKSAAGIYDKLLRLNGNYQDCEVRLRRLRRLPVDEARAMSAYFETTGSGSGRGVADRRRGSPPVLGEVAGRFSLLSLLGVGGSGVVFLAKDKAEDRLVALKRIRPEVSRSPGGRALFVQEAKTLSQLRHSRIVEFYEAVEYEDDLYLVLEYVDWETLQTVLALRGRLTYGEVAPILRAVAEALAFAHQNKVIHRDLKPGNIVAGPKGFVKVMDFGIARHFDLDASDLQEVEVVGTPPYMAPEQHAGITTSLSDIYSFGVTAYTLLTGRLPFAGPQALYYSQKMERDYPKLPAELPASLRELVDACLMFDPGKRPPDAAALLRMLGG